MSPPDYSNPKPPEGISSGHEHPLLDVAKSAAIVIASLVALVAAAFFAARIAAPLIPFAWEQKLADRPARAALDGRRGDAARQAYLQDLADRLTAAIALPEGMTIEVHFVADDTVNAFATLGGHVVIFDGVWHALDSENAMAMLLGHEIAHVKNRDPIRSISGALLASLVAASVLGDTGFLGELTGAGSLVTALHFSREQEARADAEAAAAVAALYGHLNGATDLFAALRTASAGAARPPAVLASHPDLTARIVAVERRARDAGWPLEGAKTALP